MKLKLLVFLAVFACSIGAKKANAQKDSTAAKLFGLPVLYSTPETRFGFGALLSYAFRFNREDTISPPSNIQLAAVYTQNKQTLFYMPYQLYWNNRKYTARGELSYYKYSYRYFGIGDETIVGGELYTVDFPRIRFTGLYQFKPKWFGGVQFNFDGYDIKDIEAGGLLEQGAPGSEGGNISGIGPALEFDSRDNVYSAHSGWFLRSTLAVYDEALGSEYDFIKSRIDLRKYLTKGKITLATQLYFESTTDGVPFYQMARVGGTKLLRGYFQGRYQDRHMLAAQMEARMPVIWRLGGVLFVGAGEAYRIAPDGKGLNWSGGAGVRISIDPVKRLNLRIDYAFGEAESEGLYFTIGEAF